MIFPLVAYRALQPASRNWPIFKPQFLAITDDVVRGHGAVERRPFLLLLLDQPRHAIERNPAVIPDDAPAAIGVGQPR
jgi:hypothetical protein